MSTSGQSSFPKKGEDDFLSHEEIAFMQRLTSRPEAFSQQFWSMVMQKVALDGQPIPQSQVQGLSQLRGNYATFATSGGTTTSTTFGGLSSGSGPTLANLANGSYAILFGAQVFFDTDGSTGLIGVSINGGAVDTQEMATVGVSGITTVNISTGRATVATLDKNNNNTIQVKYASLSGSSVTFDRSWIIALRIGN